MSQAFGIMDAGYFVPRTQIFKWINSTLHLNITQIQQLGTGSIYCQLLDSLYPGRIQLSKVNWKAKLEYQYLQNYKLLQTSFQRLGITKKIEVQKLSKCKYQDNLQMIQWLKRFIELQGGSKSDYDAESRRGKVEIDLQVTIEKKKLNLTNKQNHKKNSSLILTKTDSSKQLGKQCISLNRTLNPNKKSLQNLKLHDNINYSSNNNIPSRIQRKYSIGSFSKKNSDENKILVIKQILKNSNSCVQLQRIRQLLLDQKIEEQEQLEYI